MILSDQQKVGVSLTLFGSLFFFLGILFVLDGALMAIGNLLFMAGLPLILGLTKTVKFFSRKSKRVASASFLTGITLVFLKWVFFGLIFEGFGVLSLFGDFIPVVIGVLRNLPIIGNFLNMPFIRHLTDRLTENRRMV